MELINLVNMMGTFTYKQQSELEPGRLQRTLTSKTSPLPQTNTKSTYFWKANLTDDFRSNKRFLLAWITQHTSKNYHALKKLSLTSMWLNTSFETEKFPRACGAQFKIMWILDNRSTLLHLNTRLSSATGFEPVI